MKKTIITLLVLAGAAIADTTYDLTALWNEVKFGTEDTLTASNNFMTWDGTNAYTNWYMEFSLTTVTATGYKATITAGPYSSNSSGLSVSAKSGVITLGKGNTDVIDSTKSLSFDTSDVLTFAFYDGKAYLGNKTDNTYISVTPPSGLVTTMTSGTSRAWANGATTGSTQIGATKIVNLGGLTITAGEKLDMATLMKTGVAQSVTIPEPTTATLSLLALAGLAARRRRK